MLAALLLTLLSAPRYDALAASSRFQLKCLYCHSGSVVEERRRSIPEWRAVLERMRQKSPLLISRDDTRVLLRYLVYERKLGVKSPRPAVRPPPAVVAVEVPAPPTEPVAKPPVEPEEAPVVEEETLPAPPPAEDLEALQRGPELLEEKCSKCHPLGRVLTKVDSAERGVATIERMRRKTGSGISRADAELLERYLRLRL